MNKTEAERARLHDEATEQSRLLGEFEKRAAEGKEMALKDQEKSHLEAAEELEDLYEKRLALEIQRYNKLKEDKEDQAFHMEEEMGRVKEQNEIRISEICLNYDMRLKMEEDKCRTLEDEKKQLETYYNEVLMQTEIDLEDHVNKMSTRIIENQKLSQVRESKLKVDNSIMKRHSLRLKKDKVLDAKTMKSLRKEAKRVQVRPQESGCMQKKTPNSQGNEKIYERWKLRCVKAQKILLED